MKKKILILLTFCMLTVFPISCGTDTNTTADTSTPEINEISEEETPTANESTSVKEKTSEANKTSTQTGLPDGLLSHLCDVANDPNATTNMEPGVSYFFVKDDSGNRTLGSISAYYTNLNISASDKKSFCKAYLDSEMPEIADKFDNAEFHDEGGYYGVVMEIPECYVTLMPDNSLKGMTVFVTVK